MYSCLGQIRYSHSQHSLGNWLQMQSNISVLWLERASEVHTPWNSSLPEKRFLDEIPLSGDCCGRITGLLGKSVDSRVNVVVGTGNMGGVRI